MKWCPAQEKRHSNGNCEKEKFFFFSFVRKFVDWMQNRKYVICNVIETYRAFGWHEFGPKCLVQIHSCDASHLATAYFCVIWHQLGRRERKLMSSGQRKTETMTLRTHARAEYFWPENRDRKKWSCLKLTLYFICWRTKLMSLAIFFFLMAIYMIIKTLSNRVSIERFVWQ